MMPGKLFSVLLLILLAVASWSQEDDAAVEPVEVTTAPDTENAATETPVLDDDSIDQVDDEAIYDGDLDQQVYEEDDDDFVPTEEIPADEPIPFPSNI